MASAAFDSRLFRFLRELSKNNNRDWFQDNKQRYEDCVREPALQFVRDFAPRLKKLSPFFVASDKKVGGSLMRVYRDTRFSKDKTPYKTNVGIHFRHQMCGDVHAPGFYVHLESKQCFLGVGVWHPDSSSLGQIRAMIDEEPTKWRRARDQRDFCSHFELSGDSLKTAPRGYAKDHPLLDDLKRKDFIGVEQLTEATATADDFIDATEQAFRAARPFMRFLCESLQIPF